jgi:hypothetical protein
MEDLYLVEGVSRPRKTHQKGPTMHGAQVLIVRSFREWSAGDIFAAHEKTDIWKIGW